MQERLGSSAVPPNALPAVDHLGLQMVLFVVWTACLLECGNVGEPRPWSHHRPTSPRPPPHLSTVNDLNLFPSPPWWSSKALFSQLAADGVGLYAAIAGTSSSPARTEDDVISGAKQCVARAHNVFEPVRAFEATRAKALLTAKHGSFLDPATRTRLDGARDRVTRLANACVLFHSSIRIEIFRVQLLPGMNPDFGFYTARAENRREVGTPGAANSLPSCPYEFDPAV